MTAFRVVEHLDVIEDIAARFLTVEIGLAAAIERMRAGLSQMRPLNSEPSEG